MKALGLATLLAIGLAASASAWAAEQIQVSNAWAKATLPGQKVAGVYLDIASPVDAKLVAVSTPGAKRAEVHSMKLEDGVMRMRHVESLPIAAGKPAKLAPGGIHLMLFDLARPLEASTRLPLKLTFELAAGGKQDVTVTALVREDKAAHGGHGDH